MDVFEPVKLANLEECRFISAEQMNLNIFFADNREICFLGNVSQSNDADFKHRYFRAW